jgi:ParB family chromosome partitioning protein
MLAFRGMLQETDAEIERLKAELTKLPPAELPLAELHEIPGRRRKLSDEDFEALKENLRQHALITPVTVRARVGGGYEIVSGHNRVAALRELGRTSVKVTILEADDAAADLGAFYANLLHPSLPDFAKFQGFSKRMAATGQTQQEVAREAGIKETTMVRWMSFAGLPANTLELIASAPDRVGGNAARELVHLLSSIGAAAVHQAVEEMVLRGVPQEKAIQAARDAGKTREAEPFQAAAPIVIKQGKSTFCTVRAKGAVLQLQFKSAAEADDLKELILDVIRARTLAAD